MKNNASIVYNVCLVIGDFLALVAAFVTAYILRVTISHRVLSQQISALDYIRSLVIILPFFIFVFALLGLYNSRIHEQRFHEIGRLIVGSFIGTLFVISFSYITNTVIFPARLVTFYGFGLAFVLVFLFRTIARGIRRELFAYGIGINNVIIIGDTRLARILIKSLANTAVTGYNVRALVENRPPQGRPSRHYQHFHTFADAVTELGNDTHTIIQTRLFADDAQNEEILTYAQEHHAAYRFVPGNNELFTGNIEAEVFHSVPVISVHQTPLVGWGRVVKRIFDVLAALVALIIAAPFMILVGLSIKLFDHGPIFFKQERLSRFDTKVQIFKFRTHLTAYNGLTPEEAFAKMSKPELILEYRAHADSLERDPRIGRLGHFLRSSKLDELPQLINVLKGDISLVGPRALVPFELEQYSQKNLILSVKSGLTGLAQVSGRADMSFQERRALDLYYVQNWSFWGDLTILIRTSWIVFFHRGTR